MIIHALGDTATPSASVSSNENEEAIADDYVRELERSCSALGIEIDSSSTKSCRRALERFSLELRKRLAEKSELERRQRSGAAGGRPIGALREELITTVLYFAENFRKQHCLGVKPSLDKAIQLIQANERRPGKRAAIGDLDKFSKAVLKTYYRQKRDLRQKEHLRRALLGVPKGTKLPALD
jgi:hypothetical protein